MRDRHTQVGLGRAARLVLIGMGLAAQDCSGTAVIDGAGDGTGGAGAAGGGGAAGSGAGATGQGGQGGGQACGDPVALAHYPACASAGDQSSCEAAGGSWTIVGLDHEPRCLCPTGQGGCPCNRLSQCLSACVADPVDGVFDCEGVVAGHCSPVSITVGCLCWFIDETGVPQGMCTD
ncbi:MAG: hypothetical protein HY744_15320 [Deltaproteobacteria bacterium]|nr:hypothetical protein [Deltaproteobacteria bacterium]